MEHLVLLHKNNCSPYLRCPSDCNQNDMLQLFQYLTPPNCPFRPVKIWKQETRKIRRKRSACSWCVLYQKTDPEVQYLQGSQGKELYNVIRKYIPIGGDIVDYKFHCNSTSEEEGWLVIWKNRMCIHYKQNSGKFNTTSKEDTPILPILSYGQRLEICNLSDGSSSADCLSTLEKDISGENVVAIKSENVCFMDNRPIHLDQSLGGGRGAEAGQTSDLKNTMSS